MKREIKFRGKKTDTGEWIYGNLHIPNALFTGIFICPNTTFGDIAPGFRDGDDFEETQKYGVAIGHYKRIIPESLGQFTGLKDKKGKDIYEGDILKLQYPLNYGFAGIHNKELIVSITFDNGCFWFSGEEHTDCYWHHYNEYEVIGNIYENPELLK